MNVLSEFITNASKNLDEKVMSAWYLFIYFISHGTYNPLYGSFRRRISFLVNLPHNNPTI